MKREDITHLADLARIELTEGEVERFSKEFDDILGYVDRVKGLAEGGALEPAVGAVFNVLRKDENPHESGLYTEDLLNAAPAKEGKYVRVKKIIDQHK